MLIDTTVSATETNPGFLLRSSATNYLRRKLPHHRRPAIPVELLETN